MDAKLIKETLQVTIQENLKDEWVSLADLGPKLISNGLNYKDLGYLKLFDLIKIHSDAIELRIDKTHRLPNYYVQLRSNPIKARNNSFVSPRNVIIEFAYLGHYQTMIKKLKDLALEERWYYKELNPDFPYPILVNYLHYTFYRLMKEKDKILYADNFAAINTGLVDKRYEPIYALFIKNDDNHSQPWKLFDFCIAGEGPAGKNLVRYFTNKPDRAHYFANVSDMLYETRSAEPEMDIKHIIIDNVNRLPFNFISENKPKDFELKNPEILSVENKVQYFKNLAAAIESDKKAYRNITNRFKDALELAIKRVEWNFKTAIPMYYPTFNKMSLLLPLALVDDEIVDIALVVEKQSSGNYIGHTILPLSWAYGNARLVARPDSDWLVAENIETDVEDPIESEEEL
jgi:hypothetical protein